MFESFFSNLSMWAQAIVDVIVEIFNRIISFLTDVVDWFRKMINGVRTKIAYIITLKKLREKLERMGIGEILEGPDIKRVENTGIYDDPIVEAVHDEEEDKITAMRIIASSEGMDDRLNKILRESGIAQLG